MCPGEREGAARRESCRSARLFGGEQAESLAEKSDQLNEQASVFKNNSKTLKKQMAWKNLKMTLILGGVVAIVLIVILVPLIVKLKKLGGGD